MVKYVARYIAEVEIELDETKFDEEFMKEFQENFYNFDTIEEHVEHIAQLEARGLLEDFTERYGYISEMGIKAKVNYDNVEDVGLED